MKKEIYSGPGEGMYAPRNFISFMANSVGKSSLIQNGTIAGNMSVYYFQEPLSRGLLYSRRWNGGPSGGHFGVTVEIFADSEGGLNALENQLRAASASYNEANSRTKQPGSQKPASL